jgi:hypothetical protein
MILASSGCGRQTKQKFPGRRCLSFCTWAKQFLLNGARPGIKDPSRKAEDKAMFQGTTIEELINSVVRAEDHAREQEKMQGLALERQYPLRRFEWRQEMVEVA